MTELPDKFAEMYLKQISFLSDRITDARIDAEEARLRKERAASAEAQARSRAADLVARRAEIQAAFDQEFPE